VKQLHQAMVAYPRYHSAADRLTASSREREQTNLQMKKCSRLACIQQQGNTTEQHSQLTIPRLQLESQDFSYVCESICRAANLDHDPLCVESINTLRFKPSLP